MFLTAMLVAMVVEAGLCLPNAEFPRGRNRESAAWTEPRPPGDRSPSELHHERLPIAHIPLDAVDGGPLGRWPCCSRPDTASSPGGAAATASRWDCSSCCGWSIVAIVAVMLNQPEWIEEFRPEEKPTIAVLWDASPSMETRDVVQADQPTSTATTRREAVAPLADPAAWDRLRQRMNVVIQPFSAPSINPGSASSSSAAAASGTGQGTDLYSPLARAPERISNLRGIVLASDGDWNEGQPPVQAAARLRMKGVPILAVPVGSRTRLPDVELLSLDLPTFGVAGQVGPRPVHDRQLAAARIPDDRHAQDLRRRPGLQGRADRPDEPDQRLARLEAEGSRRLHADALDPQARRRDLGREQHAHGPDRDPRGEAPRPARRVLPAMGIPIPAGTPCRATPASSCRACCSTRA